MCDDPRIIEYDDYGHTIPVPCGRCPPCVKRRTDEWVFRLQEEEKNYSSSHFITLTYAPHTLPRHTFERETKSKVKKIKFPTLRKRHFQLFVKRLRQQLVRDGYTEKLKYYACGEYGTNFRRPHYHAIIFGCPAVAYYADAWTYRDEETKEKRPLGTIDFRPVIQNRLAYVVGYFHESKGKPWPGSEKEFKVSSKDIGKSYLIKNGVYTQAYHYHRSHPADLFLVRPGGHKIAMPRYYRNIIWNEEERQAQLPIIQASISQVEAEERSRLAAKGIDYEYQMYIDRENRKRRYEQRILEKNRKDL